MSDKPFNEQAAFLIETSMDLIKQVLTKHSAAVLEEMHDQIVARNQRIKQLEDELEWDKTEKSNYSKILSALGMEEEGDPVQGVFDLITERDKWRDEADELDRRVGRIMKDRETNE